MAIEIMDRRIVDAARVELAKGARPLDLEIRIVQKFGVSYETAARYVKIAQTRDIDRRDAPDGRLTTTASRGFRAYLNRQ